MKLLKNGFILLFLIAALPQIAAATDEEFESFLKQQESEFGQFQQQYLKEFDEFVIAWKQAETQYKKEISKKWDNPILPSKKVWVSYSEDLNTRTSIDYGTGRVKVEFNKLSDDAAPIANATKIFKKLATQNVQKALLSDPVYREVSLDFERNVDTNNEVNTSSEVKLASTEIKLLTPLLISKSIAEKTPTVSTDSNVTSVIFELPEQSLPQKAKPFMEEIQKQANLRQISPSLLLAIIHTESSFNPMARSSIPAFGLMQIVPTTAGVDVSVFINGKPLLYTPEYLFQPSNNIEAGSTYLHILYQRYFKAVRNETSKKYLAIAAYNTGIGNVAKTLTGTSSLNRAAIAANLMSPQQLHQKLLRNLPAEETRNYLRKVLKRSDDYEKIIKGI